MVEEISYIVKYPFVFRAQTVFTKTRLGPARVSLMLLIFLAVLSWSYILTDSPDGVARLFMKQTWQRAGVFIAELGGQGVEGQPAFFKGEEWADAGKLAYRTLAMSVLAILIASVGALFTFLPASRNVASGELAAAALPSKALYYILRGFFILTRGVPELIVAMIVIFFFSPGILPGAIALGVHNLGILGKLSAEVVENLDTRPARALRNSGASTYQILVYAILPITMPQILTYILYRWEVIMRTTIVVGFVSAAGLGREFRLDMSFFRYTDVALLLIWYLILVILADIVSMFFRRLAR